MTIEELSDQKSATQPKAAWRTKRICSSFTLTIFLLATSLGIVTNLIPFASLDSPGLLGALRLFSRTTKLRTGPHFLFQTYHDELSQPLRERPKLVIHLGPHKTASTTLQTDLTYYQDRLHQDGYVYLGRIYHPYSNGERIVLNRSPDTLIQTYFRDMFNRCWKPTKRECVEDLRDLLRSEFNTPYRPIPSLLISDEAFLKLFDDKSDEDINENFVLMKEVLCEDWDIVLVLAYRRFYEWLPSAKHQKDKPTNDLSKKQWPGPGSRGVSLRSLFPTRETSNETKANLYSWGREHFFSQSTVNTLRSLKSPNFQLKIYHMYGKMSVRTTFLCKVVPHAPFSCRSSLQQDSFQQETRMNARSESENANIPSYPSAFFDFIATSSSMMVNTEKWKRQEVARMIREHYYTASAAFFQNVTAISNSDPEEAPPDEAAITNPPTNPWLLPLVCPSPAQLALLEQHSLTIEALYIPKLYQKSHAQHRAAVRSMARTSPDYCWVNATALLLPKTNDTTSTKMDGTGVWRDFIVETFG